MGNTFTYWTYMVECKYGTYYTGWTNDIKKRIAAHNDGTGAKYLRGKGPVKLVYKKKFPTVLEAQAHERLIKKLKRKEKINLIKIGSFLPLEGLPLSAACRHQVSNSISSGRLGGGVISE